MKNLISKSFLVFLPLLLILLTLFLIQNNAMAEESYIIKIGENNYNSITEAIENSKDYAEIEVSSLTTEPVIIYENIISEGKNYTLNLNNVIIDGKNQDRVFYIKGGKVIINGGVFTNGSTESNKYRQGYKSGGSGLLISNENSDVTLNNVTIKNNVANYGGGILIEKGTLTLNSCNVTENSAQGKEDSIGGGILVEGPADLITDKNTKISSNNANNGSAIYCSGAISLKNTNINNNSGLNSTNEDDGIIYFSQGDRSIRLKNCTIYDNNNIPNTISSLTNPENKIEIEDCYIKDNEATRTGGISLTHGDLKINSSVIKNNHVNNTDYSYSAGGIFVNSIYGTLSYNSGAIYNNTNTNGAQDIYKKGYKAININILEASDMVDYELENDSFFKGYRWIKETGLNSVKSFINKVEIPKYEDDLKLSSLYVDPDRDVVEYNGKPYKSLQTAIGNIPSGSTGNVITLISDIPIIESEASNFFINKKFTLDLNGKTLQVSTHKSDDTVLGLNTNSNLTIIGTGEIIGAITLKTNSSKLNLNSFINGDLVLKRESANSLLTINIEEKFNCTGSVFYNIWNTKLSSLNKLDESKEVNFELLNDEYNNFDLDKLIINGIYNPFLEIKKAGSKIVLHQDMLPTENAFVIAADGDDTNIGSISNPLKTVEAAISKLNGKNGIIYLKDSESSSPYIIEEDTSWIVPENQNITIKRLVLSSNIANRNMFEVKNSKLTLQNITIDGQTGSIKKGFTQKPSSSGHIIEVSEGATLILNKSAQLTNNSVTNNNTTNSDFYFSGGGAVYSKGDVILNGGNVNNCKAFYGGAIFMNNKDAKLVINKDSILENNCAEESTGSKNATYSPRGGAVYIQKGAKLILYDGLLRNNFSYGKGGAIALGPGSSFDQLKDVSPYMNDSIFDLTMLGGTITENISGSEGGGIYIQGSYKGIISGGYITNNESLGGLFGGGAIYVNGKETLNKNVLNGKIVILNAEITNNIAQDSGGGLAVCGTGSTVINSNQAGLIYNNKSLGVERLNPDIQERKDDLSLQTSNGESGNSYDTPKSGAEDSITTIALENSPYNWRYVEKNNSSELASENYFSGKYGKHLYSDTLIEDQTIIDNLGTHITGNKSQTRGGAIGSNGNVVIGNESPNSSEIEIKKIWRSESDLTPNLDNIKQVNIWSFATKDNNVVSYSYNSLFDGSTWNNSVKFKKIDGFDYIYLEDVVYENGVHYWSEPSEPITGLKETVIPYIMSTYGLNVSYKFTSDPSVPFTSQFENNTFINTITSTKLVIEKDLSGELTEDDYKQSFNFSIQFSFNEDELTGSYKKNNDEFIPIKNSDKFDQVTNTLKFELSYKDSITFINLPVNTNYVVTEDSNGEFTSSFNEKTNNEYIGSFTEDNLIQFIKVTNKKNDPPSVNKEETAINGTDLNREPVNNGYSYPKVKIGDIVTYHISWENISNKTKFIEISDALDPGTDFISASYGSFKLTQENDSFEFSNKDELIIKYDLISHKVTWRIPTTYLIEDLNYVELKVKVNSKAQFERDPETGNLKDTKDNQISNQAYVELDNNYSITTETVTNQVEETEDLKIIKTGIGDGLIQNDSYEIYIELSNENLTDGSQITVEKFDTSNNIIYEVLTLNNKTIMLTLKAGEIAFLKNLPVGTEYLISEKEGAYTSSIDVTKGKISSNLTSAIEVTNTLYNPTNSEITLAKVLNNYNFVPENRQDSFRFTLTPLTGNSEKDPYENGTVFEINLNEINLTGSTEKVITLGNYSVVGEYSYLLEEKIPDDTAGFNYDSAVYFVHVSVTDQNGSLVAITTINPGINTNTDRPVFTNEYSPFEVELSIRGQKSLVERPLTESDKFTFEISAIGDSSLNTPLPVETRVENYYNRIIFEPIKYDKPGEYYYEISEVHGNDNNLIYSEQKYRVKVTVEDNGQGILSASYQIIEPLETNEIIFENHSKTGDLSISKTILSGNDSAISDESFEFEIILKNNNYSGMLETEYADGTSYGQVQFVNGVGKVALSHGQKVKIKGIAYGTEYSVREINSKGYYNSSVNEEGIIAAENTNPQVEFYNSKDIFTKTEQSPGANTAVKGEDEITYNINWLNHHTETAEIVITDTLDKNVDFVSASHNGSYDKDSHTVNWNLGNQEPLSKGFVELKVKVKDEINNSNKVTNQAEGKIGNDSVIKTNIVENPVDHPEDPVEKVGGLTVSKTVISDNLVDLLPTNTFKFKVSLATDKLTNENQNIQYRIVNQNTKRYDTELTQAKFVQVNGVWEFNLLLSNGQTAEFINIPAGATYLVTEDLGLIPEYFYDRTSYEGIIPEESSAHVSYTNYKKNETSEGSLVIQKIVDDKNIDRNAGYLFTINVNNQLNGKYGSATFINGQATIILRHLEQAVITGLPIGTVYTVSEESLNGFETSWIPNAEADGAVRGIITEESKSATLTCINKKVEETTDTESPESPKKPSVSIVKKQSLTDIYTDGYIQYDSKNNVITYEITIQNTGEVEATDVVITDRIPTGTSLVSGSLIPEGTITGNTISWMFDKLEPGEVQSVYFTVIIEDNAGEIENTAHLTYKDDEPKDSNKVQAGTEDKPQDSTLSPEYPSDSDNSSNNQDNTLSPGNSNSDNNTDKTLSPGNVDQTNNESNNIENTVSKTDNVSKTNTTNNAATQSTSVSSISPKTGLFTSLGVWVFLMGASGLGLVYERKRKNNK